MPAQLRIAIVGAASLRGKELNEALGESPFAAANFLLMDDEEALGQLEAVGEEVTFIQQITSTSFEGVDFTFFTGAPELTRKHWRAATEAGSAIIDLSGALAGEPGAVIGAPWVQAQSAQAGAAPSSSLPLDLHTAVVLPAHPAALTLALLTSRLQGAGAVSSAFATVLEPASEYGRAAMDELHQQTVNLLSFQALPKAWYDTQIAFNLTPVSGEEGKIDLSASERRIRGDYTALAAGKLPAVAVQLIHAPVFHGYTISVGVAFAQPVEAGQVIAALAGEHIEVMQTEGEIPSNLAAAGQEDVLVRVRAATGEEGPSTQFWLWGAADNLKLTALNAVACALEMRRMRPQGQVQ